MQQENPPRPPVGPHACGINFGGIPGGVADKAVVCGYGRRTGLFFTSVAINPGRTLVCEFPRRTILLAPAFMPSILPLARKYCHAPPNTLKCRGRGNIQRVGGVWLQSNNGETGFWIMDSMAPFLAVRLCPTSHVPAPALLGARRLCLGRSRFLTSHAVSHNINRHVRNCEDIELCPQAYKHFTWPVRIL